MRLTALKCTENWEKAAGFNITESQIHLADLDILVEEGDGGIIAWGWDPLPEGIHTICGVPAFHWKKEKPGAKHQNCVLSVDHVVLHSNNAENIKKEFAALQIQVRAERENLYPGITQLFFRPGGGTIIEAVIGKDYSPKNFIWGVTLVVSDIEAVSTLLGDNASKPKKAIQPGRQILTVRTGELGIKTKIAMMTPHTKASKL